MYEIKYPFSKWPIVLLNIDFQFWNFSWMELKDVIFKLFGNLAQWKFTSIFKLWKIWKIHPVTENNIFAAFTCCWHSFFFYLVIFINDKMLKSLICLEIFTNWTKVLLLRRLKSKLITKSTWMKNNFLIWKKTCDRNFNYWKLPENCIFHKRITMKNVFLPIMYFCCVLIYQLLSKIMLIWKCPLNNSISFILNLLKYIKYNLVKLFLRSIRNRGEERDSECVWKKGTKSRKVLWTFL